MNLIRPDDAAAAAILGAWPEVDRSWRTHADNFSYTSRPNAQRRCCRAPTPAWVSGPGELFDARFVTMPRCCLLSMKMSPQDWVETDGLYRKRETEADIAGAWNAAIDASSLMPLRDEYHLAWDADVHLQVRVGAVAMSEHGPVAVVYRDRGLRKAPSRVDVVATLCAIHLCDCQSGVLVYDGPTPLVVGIARSIATYESVTGKTRRLRQRMLVPPVARCAHAADFAKHFEGPEPKTPATAGTTLGANNT